MERDGDIPGLLKTVHLTEDEMLAFLDYMERDRGEPDFDVLFNLFDSDDMFKFLDMFSGRTLKIPKRDHLVKIITYIKIYVYVKSRGYDEKTVAQASKVFDKKSSSIVRIYQKIEGVLSQDPKPYVITRRKDNV